MKTKPRIAKKTLGWIAAAFLLAGMFSACNEMEGLIEVEDMQPEKENNGGRYTVSTSITPEGGGTVTAIPNSNLAKGATVRLVIAPAEGYGFVGLTVTGWTGIMASSGSAYTFTMPAANVTISAVFVDLAADDPPSTLYRVTIEQAAGGAVDANLDYAVAGAAVTLTATPDTGYKLVSGPTVTTATVTGDGPYTFTMPEADVTVSAGFTGIQYTVIYDINAGTGTPPAKTTHTYGEDLILASSGGFSRDGYNFVRWNTEADGSGTNYEAGASVPELSSTEGDEVTLYAQWLDAAQRMITFNSHGGTDVTSITVNTGTEVQKPADPTWAGYNFVGWYDAAEDGTEYTWPHTLSSSVTMHAHWTAIQYSITYHLNEGTNAGDNPASYTIESGDITLVDPNRTSYNFAGWYDNSGFNGSPVTSIPAGSTGNKTFYAKWTEVAASSAIPINNPASVSPSGWTFTSSTVTITTTGNYTITGTTVQNRVVVSSSVTARILLKNVDIDVSSVSNACAFYITPGAMVNLILAKDTTNTLKSNGQSAGLQVPAGATLSITSEAGPGRISGTLNAYGGWGSIGGQQHSGAGIGGGQAQSGGNITISGGTINAYGFYDGSTNYPNAGAGIGGGGYDTSAGTPKAGDGGNITILGGAVTAVAGSSKTTSGEGAAGIGGGSGKADSDNSGGTGGVIQITGGTVIASSRINGAGIGGGCVGAGGSITIGGSAVVTATGGHSATGIGGGYMGASGNIIINGTAQVTAMGGDRCPGIGSGMYAGAGSADSIYIYGVKYEGYGNGSGGNGQGSGDPKTITINKISPPGQVISTSGANTRVAIGEGDY